MNEALARAGIFQGVAPDSVAALAEQLRQVSFPRGHTVFREGDSGDLLYIIDRGAVKISQLGPVGRNRLIAILGPGDMFGELALFDPGPRTSTVTTLTRVEALTMDRDALRSWIATRPEISEQLLRVLARRLRRTTSVIADLIFTDVAGRVAGLLLDLANRYGKRDNGVLRLDHELTQEEFAQLVGSTRESVNKALSVFVVREWITLQGKTILIRQPDRLAKRAR